MTHSIAIANEENYSGIKHHYNHMCISKTQYKPGSPDKLKFLRAFGRPLFIFLLAL
jgi:hypothetical protein